MEDETRQYEKKIMINCASVMLDRCEALRDYVAQTSLRGKAKKADVIRTALALGLDALEQQAREEID